MVLIRKRGITILFILSFYTLPFSKEGLVSFLRAAIEISFLITPGRGCPEMIFPLQICRRVRQKHKYRVLDQEELIRKYGEYGSKIVLRDETGKDFILKQGLTFPLEMREKVALTEKVAFLLGREKVNVAEVRIIDKEELELLGIRLGADWADKMALVRKLEDYEFSELTQQRGSREGLFVFYVFIRDDDHLFLDLPGIQENVYGIGDGHGGLEYISFDHELNVAMKIFEGREEKVLDIDYFISLLSTQPRPFFGLYKHKLNLSIVARKIKEFENYSADEIRQILYRSGYKGKILEQTLNVFLRLKRNLKQDVERVLQVMIGEKVDLSKYF